MQDLKEGLQPIKLNKRFKQTNKTKKGLICILKKQNKQNVEMGGGEEGEKEKGKTKLTIPNALLLISTFFSCGCFWRGIYLTRKWENVDQTEPQVAQKYMHKPFTIDGLKFDMRVYVLVTSCDPLRIYIYRDGEFFDSFVLYL